jgi:hypothetical protein
MIRPKAAPLAHSQLRSVGQTSAPNEEPELASVGHTSALNSFRFAASVDAIAPRKLGKGE